MARNDLKLSEMAVRLSFLLFAILLGINVLKLFGIVDYTDQVFNLFNIFAGFILLAEMGLLTVKQNLKGIDIVRMIGVIASGLSILGGFLGIINTPIPALSGIVGFVQGGLLVVLLIEAFRPMKLR